MCICRGLVKHLNIIILIMPRLAMQFLDIIIKICSLSVQALVLIIVVVVMLLEEK